MKLIVVTIFALFAVSAFAEEFEPMENWVIDWSKVTPIQDQPGFWDGREIKPVFQPAAGQRRTGRIAGGIIVTPHTHPYQVALLIQSSAGLISLCGGSRVSERTVLTAAHCPFGSLSTQLIFGAHDIFTIEANQFRETVGSAQYRIHGSYNPLNFSNDIALIITTSIVPTNEYIQNIALAPNDSGTFAGVLGTISGWGRVDTTQQTSAQLLSLNVLILTNAVCSQFWSDIIPTHICALWRGRGPCDGDNGGPLTALNGGEHHQIGVFSIASGCANDVPAIYVRVANYQPWILSQMIA